MTKRKTLKYQIENENFEFNIRNGTIIDIIQNLENKKVLSVAQEAQRRSIAYDVNSIYANMGYIDCPKDMFVVPKKNNREFAIVLDSKDLLEVNRNTQLKLGAIILPDNQKEFEGEYTKWFKKEDLILNKLLTFDEYMDHEGWSMLLRDPKVEGMPKEIATHPNFKEHYGRQVWEKTGKNIKTDKLMGFYLAEETYKNFTAGSLFCLDNINYHSNVYCSDFSLLDHNSGKILIAEPKILNKLNWTPKSQLEDFLNESKNYIPEMLRESYKNFISKYEITKKNN